MNEKTVNIKVFRFDPSKDKEPYYKNYKIPLKHGMSAFNALEYIYQNIDSTLAYYDHAGCYLGICMKCLAKINGKSGLLCQTRVTEDITLEPISTSNVIKDLVKR